MSLYYKIDLIVLETNAEKNMLYICNILRNPRFSSAYRDEGTCNFQWGYLRIVRAQHEGTCAVCSRYKHIMPAARAVDINSFVNIVWIKKIKHYYLYLQIPAIYQYSLFGQKHVCFWTSFRILLSVSSHTQSRRFLFCNKKKTRRPSRSVLTNFFASDRLHVCDKIQRKHMNPIVTHA